MKEVEVTLRINESLESCKYKLEQQGFKIIRKSLIDDIYMTQKKNALNEDNIDDILRSSVLIRYLNVEGKEFKKITYKNKQYDGSNIVSEKKINVECSDLNKARELFEALGFEELVRVKYDVIVFADGKREFAFQDVDNLGLLVEYESTKDMETATVDEIMEEKMLMRKEIRDTGISTSDELDVKKAYELIQKGLLEK